MNNSCEQTLTACFTYIEAYDFDDSPRAHDERDFVIKQSDKKKVAKENRREVGFEYDNDVTSDTQLCQKILETGTYNSTYESMIDFSEDLSRIIVKLSRHHRLFLMVIRLLPKPQIQGTLGV